MTIETKPYSVSRTETLRVSIWLAHGRISPWIVLVIGVCVLALTRLPTLRFAELFSQLRFALYLMIGFYVVVLLYIEVLLRNSTKGKLGKRNEMTHRTRFADGSMYSETGEDRDAKLPLSDFECVESDRKNVLFFMSRFNVCFVPLSAFTKPEDINDLIFQLDVAGVKVKDRRQ